MIIDSANVSQKITVASGGKEALEYLSERVNGGYPNPEIIFLDINMPGMSGWDFLAEYVRLEDEKKVGVSICMLTTSSAKKDKERAAQSEVPIDFNSKPLTYEKLMTIIGTHFPDHL